MTHAVEYIHLQSMGNLSACARQFDIVTAQLDELKRQAGKMNYSVAVIESCDDLDDNLLRIDRVDRLTKGAYPFLWLNVTCLDSAVLAVIQHFQFPDYGLYGEASMDADIV